MEEEIIALKETLKKKNENLIKLEKETNETNVKNKLLLEELNYKDEKFAGTSLDAIFGGIELDLRGAKLEDDATIEASAIFGGITIFIPEDVAVKVVSNSIFGGVDNKHDKNIKEKTTKTIYVNANCLFGGVEIK